MQRPLFPPAIRERLDALRAAVIGTSKAGSDAASRRVHYSTLQNLQAASVEEARSDFDGWKQPTLLPDLLVKEAAVQEATSTELATFKHALSTDVEERKENARLQVLKDTAPPTTAELRLSRRKECKADPIRVSRSVSRAAGPPPHPHVKRWTRCRQRPTSRQAKLSRRSLCRLPCRCMRPGTRRPRQGLRVPPVICGRRPSQQMPLTGRLPVP